MITFDQLRISDNGQSIFIDCHVNKAQYFNSVYITKITICTENQVHETNPCEYFGDEYVYQQTFDPAAVTKELHLILNKASFNSKFTGKDLSHNMFFVYVHVEWGSAPDPCIPCRLDELTTLGVTFDYGLVYNGAMNFTRELVQDCEIPKQFLDFILNIEALKLAIETEHYIPAIEHWKTLMHSDSYRTTSLSKPCGCHG